MLPFHLHSCPFDIYQLNAHASLLSFHSLSHSTIQFLNQLKVAPVLGSIPEAQSGKLIVMVGGTEAQFECWQPLLQNFGDKPLLIGEVGSASAIKLALNQLIASLSTAFALSLGFVERQGADVDIFMQILRQSALYAPTFDKKLQRMRDRNYDNPNFPTKHLLKDTESFINEAQGEEMNISSIEG